MQASSERLRQWREYFEDRQSDRSERNFMFTDSRRKIERELRRWFKPVDREAAGKIAGGFLGLTTWYSGEAIVKAGKDDAEAWRDLQRGLLYRYWHIRIIRTFVPRGANDIVGLSGESLTLCHALATHVDDIARWFGADLKMLAQDGSHAVWDDDRVENFALWLYGQWSGDPCSSGKSLGAYQRICDAWQDGGSALENAIAAICDWRVEHTMEEDPNDEKIGWGYDYPPYAMFPAELLAAERIRREQGLEVVRPKHPLLQTPLANPPYPLPIPRDELVERAIAAIRKRYPNL
jgi:hypothetical protein